MKSLFAVSLVGLCFGALVGCSGSGGAEGSATQSSTIDKGTDTATQKSAGTELKKKAPGPAAAVN